MIRPTGISRGEYSALLREGAQTHVLMIFGNGVVLEDEDIEANGFVIRDVLNGETNYTFGKAVMKEFTVSLLNSHKLTGIKWDDEFTLKMGVDVEADDEITTNWVTVGVFAGQRPEKVHYVDVIQFTAYDRMQKLDTPASRVFDYFREHPTTPITINNILTVIESLTGVPCSSNYSNIGTRIYPEGFMNYEGLTCRDLVALIAEAMAGYAYIGNTGTLTIKQFNTASFTVYDYMEFSIETADVVKGLTWSEFEGETWSGAEVDTWNDICGWSQVYGIDGLDVKQTEEDVGIHYGNTVGNIYTIVDNPFLSDTAITTIEVETYTKYIWDVIQHTGGHLPLRVECIGNYLVEAGDIINVYVHPDVGYVQTPVYTHELRWNGHPTSVFECTGEIQRPAMSATVKEKLTNGSRFYEFRKDIDGLVSRVGVTEGTVTELKQTSEELSATVQGKYDIVSGILINEEGVRVTGAKKVEIKSGGSFEVDSTNFKINSDLKKVEAGNWTFNDAGSSLSEEILLDGTNRTVEFTVGKTPEEIDTTRDVCGLYYRYSWIGMNTDRVFYPTIFFFVHDKISNTVCTLPITLLTYTGYNRILLGSTTHGDTIGELYIYAKKVESQNIDTNKIHVGGGGYQSDSEIGESSMRFYNGYFDNLYSTNQVQTSSRDVKHDILPMPSMGERLDKLVPVTFKYNKDEDGRTRHGLIYEDTVGTMPEICTGDKDGKPEDKGINYLELVPMLLKEVQELRKRVSDLESRVNELEGNK